MVTLNQLHSSVKDKFVEYAEYLGVPSEDIGLGLNGNSMNDEFMSTGSFIRIYAAAGRVQDKNLARIKSSRPGTLTVLCGVYEVTKQESSAKSFELAERVEQLVLQKMKPIRRTDMPIFVFSNDKAMSIHAVTFFFTYDSSASEVPDA